MFYRLPPPFSVSFALKLSRFSKISLHFGQQLRVSWHSRWSAPGNSQISHKFSLFVSWKIIKYLQNMTCILTHIQKWAGPVATFFSSKPFLNCTHRILEPFPMAVTSFMDDLIRFGKIEPRPTATSSTSTSRSFLTNITEIARGPFSSEMLIRSEENLSRFALMTSQLFEHGQRYPNS